MYKPTWYIGNNKLDRVSEVELLCVTIDTKGGYDTHFSKRIGACRKFMLRLSPGEMSYPGLNASFKTYLWKTVEVPTMLHGTECIPQSNSNLKEVISMQGTIRKNTWFRQAKPPYQFDKCLQCLKNRQCYSEKLFEFL